MENANIQTHKRARKQQTESAAAAAAAAETTFGRQELQICKSTHCKMLELAVLIELLNTQLFHLSLSK